MTRQDALFKRYEIFVAAAVVASHANAPADGFRQREVKFLIELFTNWIGSTLKSEVLEMSNTQIMRYLDDLTKEGFARRTMRQNWPRYRLTRVGLIELLSRLVFQPLLSVPAHFFFLYYFVTNYKPRLEKIIREEGKQFPSALKIEVDQLLDSRALVKRQLEECELEIKKLDVRIDEAQKGAKLVSKLAQQKKTVAEIAEEVEKQFPYQLNSQKPLSELFSEIPEDLARWELETGALKRAEQLWGPTRAALFTYAQYLRKLA